VIDPKKVSELKSKLKQDKLALSFTPMSEETQNLLRRAKAQPFNCRFVGLLFIHNYLMFVRDKIIKDATQLVMLDIRGANQAEFFDQ
jgi:hypothetical protein